MPDLFVDVADFLTQPGLVNTTQLIKQHRHHRHPHAKLGLYARNGMLSLGGESGDFLKLGGGKYGCLRLTGRCRCHALTLLADADSHRNVQPEKGSEKLD